MQVRGVNIKKGREKGEMRKKEKRKHGKIENKNEIYVQKWENKGA
jgi:hypothetical protein